MQRGFRKTIWVSVLGAVLGLALTSIALSSQEERVTLETLDQIVRKAPDLDHLLADPALLDEYYTALKSYYGGEQRFPRQSFDAVVAQLRVTKDKVPGLSARLWETTHLGTPVSVTTATRTYGRALNEEGWRGFLAAWQARLDEQSSAIRALKTQEERDASLRATLTRVDLEVSQLNGKLGAANLTKKERQLRQAEFFSQLSQDPALKEAASYCLGEYLKSPEFAALMREGDPDLILDSLQKLAQNPKAALPAWLSAEALPPGVLSALQREIPRQVDLLANERLFPVATMLTRRGRTIPVGGAPAATYDFVPIPRRIHGVWKGIPIKECVGGSCESLDQLSPERWATIALKDSELFHVERNGQYTGFVQMVPIEKKGAGSEIYGSVDFGSPELKKRIIVTDPATGKERVSDLLSEWLPKASETRPAGWRGFVVGESKAIANAGVVQTVHLSPGYVLGPVRGKSADFTTLDPMAETISRISPKNDYSGRMILDGMVPDAGNLNSLVLVKPKSADIPSSIAKLLRRSRREIQLKLLRRIARAPVTEPEVQKLLVPLLVSKDDAIRHAAVLALNQAPPGSATVDSGIIALFGDADPAVRGLALDAVRNMRGSGPAIQLAMVPMLADPDPAIHEAAKKALAGLPFDPDSGVPAAIARVLSENAGKPAMETAMSLLGTRPDLAAAAQRDLLPLLKHTDPAIPPKIISALSPTHFRDRETRQAILELIGSPDRLIADRAAYSLRMTDPPSPGLALEILDRARTALPAAQETALNTVGWMKLADPAVERAMAPYLASPSEDLRKAAVEAFSLLTPTDPQAIAGIAALLNDPERSIRNLAAETLAKARTGDAEAIQAIRRELAREPDIRSMYRKSLDELVAGAAAPCPSPKELVRKILNGVAQP